MEQYGCVLVHISTLISCDYFKMSAIFIDHIIPKFIPNDAFF